MIIDVLVRPVITEKVTKRAARTDNTEYCFVVHPNANKIEIRKAVEAKYSTPVVDVRTLNTARTIRRRYTKSGVISGHTPAYKKAYVKFASPVEFDFLAVQSSINPSDDAQS